MIAHPTVPPQFCTDLKYIFLNLLKRIFLEGNYLWSRKPTNCSSECCLKPNVEKTIFYWKTLSHGLLISYIDLFRAKPIHMCSV